MNRIVISFVMIASMLGIGASVTAVAPEPPEAFVRTTAICLNGDGTYRVRIRHESGVGPVDYDLRVGGSVILGGPFTIAIGGVNFHDVPVGTNGLRARPIGDWTNTHGGTASTPRTECTPPTTTTTSTTTTTTSTTTTTTTTATSTTSSTTSTTTTVAPTTTLAGGLDDADGTTTSTTSIASSTTVAADTTAVTTTTVAETSTTVPPTTAPDTAVLGISGEDPDPDLGAGADPAGDGGSPADGAGNGPVDQLPATAGDEQMQLVIATLLLVGGVGAVAVSRRRLRTSPGLATATTS
ncbi:MAG: hypothetical protein AAGG08_08010, partial [Actinomycetota bacterium]